MQMQEKQNATLVHVTQPLSFLPRAISKKKWASLVWCRIYCENSNIMVFMLMNFDLFSDILTLPERNDIVKSISINQLLHMISMSKAEYFNVGSFSKASLSL